MPDPEDVTASAPSADPDPNDPSSSPAAAVPAVDDDTIVGDRPARNIIAELDRKVESRFNSLRTEILSALGSVNRPAPVPSQTRDYSDEDLAQLATAGDARALQMLTDRQSARHADQRMQAHSQAQTEQASLLALLGRYPVLRDDAHPLTRYAAQVKLALMRGGTADTVALVIESIKTAIADNPDLAAQAAVKMANASAPRPSVPTAAAAAPTARRLPSPSAKTTITDAQWTVAKRYGYKTREDAAKAIANFERRQESGASRLGSVAAFVREDA